MAISGKPEIARSGTLRFRAKRSGGGVTSPYCFSALPIVALEAVDPAARHAISAPHNDRVTVGKQKPGNRKGVLMLWGQVQEREYRPTEDEPFMNEQQREYFRQRLLRWKDEILREARETLLHLQNENENHPDLADRASSETDRSIELRARDRQRKLISKIDAALARIEDGTYGYCEETGEPISLRRLEARPIATLSIDAQERHERKEKVHRDERA